MPLARRILRRKTLQNLGAVVNGIGLLDKQVVCTRDNWAVGIRARDGRWRRQAVR
jgi:hypothetical protein